MAADDAARLFDGSTAEDSRGASQAAAWGWRSFARSRARTAATSPSRPMSPARHFDSRCREGRHERRTILVVDDEPQIRRVMHVTLVAQGYEVIEARSGEEALETLRAAATWCCST